MVLNLLKKIFIGRPKDDIQAGDYVKIKTLGSFGTVESLYQDKDTQEVIASLSQQNHKMKIPVKELERVD